MKNSQEVLTKISAVLRDIEENYPELHKHLDETRSTLSVGANDSDTLNKEDLENYLSELNKMKQRYENKKHL